MENTGKKVSAILIFAVAAAIVYVICKSGMQLGTPDSVFSGMVIGCLPFGWHWAGKVVTAANLWGIFHKLGFAAVLSVFAIPIILFSGILYVCVEGREMKQTYVQ